MHRDKQEEHDRNQPVARHRRVLPFHHANERRIGRRRGRGPRQSALEKRLARAVAFRLLFLQFEDLIAAPEMFFEFRCRL